MTREDLRCQRCGIGIDNDRDGNCRMCAGWPGSAAHIILCLKREVAELRKLQQAGYVIDCEDDDIMRRLLIRKVCSVCHGYPEAAAHCSHCYRTGIEQKATRKLCLKAPFGWQCLREFGHEGPCATANGEAIPQSNNGIPQVYKVETEDEPCKHCYAGQTWVIVGPGDIATGTTYGDQDEANDIADDLNAAFYEGRKSR